MQGSFLNNIVTGNPIEDIGEAPAGKTKESDRPLELESHEQRVLDDTHGILGSEQVNRRKMECAPPWIVQKAVQEEYQSNWTDSYVEVQDTDVPKDSNVIGSHVVYKVNVEENNQKY